MVVSQSWRPKMGAWLKHLQTGSTFRESKITAILKTDVRYEIRRPFWSWNHFGFLKIFLALRFWHGRCYIPPVVVKVTMMSGLESHSKSWSAVGSHGRCRLADGRLGDTLARGFKSFRWFPSCWITTKTEFAVAQDWVTGVYPILRFYQRF